MEGGGGRGEVLIVRPLLLWTLWLSLDTRLCQYYSGGMYFWRVLVDLLILGFRGHNYQCILGVLNISLHCRYRTKFQFYINFPLKKTCTKFPASIFKKLSTCRNNCALVDGLVFLLSSHSSYSWRAMTSSPVYTLYS